jgi:hypothetical protein
MTMAGLWRNNEGTREGKYLVKRRDGTVPEWPWFVLGAADPAAPAALKAYAKAARNHGMDEQYVRDIFQLASDFEDYLDAHPPGDPDKGRHRQDDPATVAEMAKGQGA